MAGVLIDEPMTQPQVQRDLRVLEKFITVYCEGNHDPKDRTIQELQVGGCDAQAHAVCLCPDCFKLLQHATVKRTNCTQSPKPACKHCLRHCYAPSYRQKIREVMKYSGRKLVMHGRLDLLWHLLF